MRTAVGACIAAGIHAQASASVTYEVGGYLHGWQPWYQGPEPT
jgi:hypothetical protein